MHSINGCKHQPTKPVVVMLNICNAQAEFTSEVTPDKLGSTPTCTQLYVRLLNVIPKTLLLS